jgi:hypothetical protein
MPLMVAEMLDSAMLRDGGTSCSVLAALRTREPPLPVQPRLLLVRPPAAGAVPPDAPAPPAMGFLHPPNPPVADTAGAAARFESVPSTRSPRAGQLCWARAEVGLARAAAADARAVRESAEAALAGERWRGERLRSRLEARAGFKGAPQLPPPRSERGLRPFSSGDGTSGPADAEVEPAPESPRVDVATLSVEAAVLGDPRAAFVAKVDGWLADVPIGGGGVPVKRNSDPSNRSEAPESDGPKLAHDAFGDTATMFRELGRKTPKIFHEWAMPNTPHASCPRPGQQRVARGGPLASVVEPYILLPNGGLCGGLC